MSALEVVIDDGDVVSGVFEAPAPELPVKFKEFLVELAVRRNVTVADILGPGRRKTAVRTRHIAMWVGRMKWKHSYPELGRMFRRMLHGELQDVDHTTVMAAVKNINKEIAKRSDEGMIALEFHDPARLYLVPGEGVMLELQSANGTTSGPMSSSESNEGSAGA